METAQRDGGDASKEESYQKSNKGSHFSVVGVERMGGRRGAGWGGAASSHVEVDRVCRTLLWAMANKRESADICTLGQLGKKDTEGDCGGRDKEEQKG